MTTMCHNSTTSATVRIPKIKERRPDATFVKISTRRFS
jgi:hypothetical protein